MRSEIVSFIQTTIGTRGFDGAVVGISGGIDSAVVGALTVCAIGRERVLGLLMPERDSAPETARDSLLVCDYLGIERISRPITRILRSAGVYRLQPGTLLVPRRIQERYVSKKLAELGQDAVFLQDLEHRGDRAFLRGLAYYRSKHRIRMVCLYLEAEQKNYAVMGTTNRSEALTGFYVKWGDEAADIDPIAHLYKTQVCELARDLGVPYRIRAKAPSPDLIPGVTDERMLGMRYSELDSILMRLDRGEEVADLDPGKVERVKGILTAARHRGVRNLSVKDNP